jgi:hypothetical protein
MNWLFYIGGGYIFYVFANITLVRGAGKQCWELEWAYNVSAAMVWVWICWRFI